MTRIALGFVAAFVAGAWSCALPARLHRPPRLRPVRLVAHHRRRHGLGALAGDGLSPATLAGRDQAACEVDGVVRMRLEDRPGPLALRSRSSVAGSRTSREMRASAFR